MPFVAAVAPAISMGLMIASTAATVVGTVMSVAAQQRQQQAQQAAYESQARMSALKGELEMANAQRQAAQLDLDAQSLMSAQMAQAAANGVSLDSGSLLSIMSVTASQADKQKLDILRNGRLAQSAANYEASAAWAAAKNSNDPLALAATVIGGVGKVMGTASYFFGGSSSGQLVGGTGFHNQTSAFSGTASQGGLTPYMTQMGRGGSSFVR